MIGFKDVRLNPYRPIDSAEVDALRGPCCKQLYQYWLGKKVGDVPPDWINFQLIDLHQIVRSVIVFDVNDPEDAGTLRYRFMGSQIVEYRSHRRNPDLTGKTFADGERAYDPGAMAQAYLECIRTGVPILMSGDYQTENAIGQHERLILPWLIDGEVRRLTCALDRFTDI